MVQKQKNALRLAYDNAKSFYKGLVSEWKAKFMTDSEYQSFIKTMSYLPVDEVPMKYHKKIEILQSMISNQAQLIRESEKGYATL